MAKLILIALLLVACSDEERSPPKQRGTGGNTFECATREEASVPADPNGTADGPYRVVHGWPALREGFVLGQVSGVALDSHGHVFVFHRAHHPWLDEPDTLLIDQPTLLRLNAETGAIEAELGRGVFVVPHGLRIDHRDHLWVTDVGTHQVHELDHDGKFLRTFGEANVAGADENHFNQPTDVAIAADGTIFVADGYGNSRVVVFDAAGTFVRAFGRYGRGRGELDTPHSIALDAEGIVYVADRGNARIQRFRADGTYLDEWKSAELGRPWALSITGDGSIFVVDGGDQNPVPPDRGRIVRLSPEGKVLDSWGAFGNQDGQIYWGHAIAVSPHDEVYVGDVRFGMRVQKFVRASAR